MGTDVEVQNEIYVFTPIQGSSSVSEHYKTGQGHLYVRAGQEK